MDGFPDDTIFEFTISNSEVTGAALLQGGKSRALSLPQNASFSVGNGTITETLTGKVVDTLVTFVETTATSNMYVVGAETQTVNAPTTTTPNGGAFGFSFTSTNEVVTGISETYTQDGVSHTSSRPLTPLETVTLSGATATEVQLVGDSVVTTSFVQPGSTLYALDSVTTTYVPANGAGTLLSIDPFERLEFTLANNAVTGVSFLAPNGSTHAVTPPSDVTFSVLAPGYVEEIVTHGSHASYEVFYEAQGASVYTEVAHGSGSTVDLVGLQAQISHLPSALAGLL